MTSAREPGDRAWLVWGGIVVGLLGGCLMAQAILITLAVSEPSVAAEPDYYQKAVAWEDHQAQVAQNQRLGWRIEVEPLSWREGKRTLRVDLRDRTGAPLSDAEVQIEAFHKARRKDVFQTTCAVISSGSYAAQLPVRRAGRWELRLKAQRGGERYTQILVRDLPGSPK